MTDKVLQPLFFSWIGMINNKFATLIMWFILVLLANYNKNENFTTLSEFQKLLRKSEWI